MKLQNMIFVAGLVALAAPLAARGDFIPPDLPAGAKYEIAFVTSAGTTATDPYEADYDAFVTAQAAENPCLPNTTWHAIASTYENGDIQDAIQNAPFTSSIPVYNTQGQLLANATTPLYSPSGNLLDPIDYDQFGNLNSTYVWTGSGLDGTWDNTLGNPVTGQYDGRPVYLYGPPDLGYDDLEYEGFYTGWAGSDGFDYEINVHPLYALSSPITVPEPGTIALLVAGLLALAGCAFPRRRSPAKS